MSAQNGTIDMLQVDDVDEKKGQAGCVMWGECCADIPGRYLLRYRLFQQFVIAWGLKIWTAWCKIRFINIYAMNSIYVLLAVNGNKKKVGGAIFAQA